MTIEKRDAGVIAAITAAGSIGQLAMGLGLDKAGVSRWKHVPSRWVREIERKYGVPRIVLRPDLYGEDE